MSIQVFRYTAASIVLLLAMMFAGPVHAQVSGGGDVQEPIGYTVPLMPDVVDLVGDPAWQIIDIGQDGIRYLEIDNEENGVHAEMARIRANVWVIQSDAQPAVTGRTVYRDSRNELVHYRQSNQDRWIVIPVTSSY